MTHRWTDADRWERKHHKATGGVRLTRSRRLLMLATLLVTFILYWHHSASPQAPSKNESPVSDPRGRRSLPEVTATVSPLFQPPPAVAPPPDRGNKANNRDDVLTPRPLKWPGSRANREQEREPDREPDPEPESKQEKPKEPEDEDMDAGDGESDAKDSTEMTAQEQQQEDTPQRRLKDDVVLPGEGIPAKEDRAGSDAPPKQMDSIDPDLDPENEKKAVIGQDPDPEEKPVEQEPEEHLSLEEKGTILPEIIHLPFEDAVKDTTLEGWEDDWVAHASFDPKKHGTLQEPKIDFVYLWVNGSEKAFQDTKRPYEEKSILNDPEGKWLSSHGTNRYRDWDELRYSLRSVEKHAGTFRNKIQILVNSVEGTAAGKQIPTWLNDEPTTKEVVQVLAQEEFFDQEKHVCLPTFNSLTIENQIFNTPSNVDALYALSDDMLLGKAHSASDITSPLFGPVMGFKTNSYSTTNAPTETDAHRFGEKPFLIYTSWLLNRRFGVRKRKGQGHFGHSLSRSVTREAIGSFPGPELQSACKRFRGEPGFQLYSWYATFHYTIERHREALLWSYIMLRSDVDEDGHLSWTERQTIMTDLEMGMKNEGKASYRKRNFYHLSQLLERAGLAAPKVNTDVLWTSLDGPSAIRDVDCVEFDVNECLAPGFSTAFSDMNNPNPVFSSALIFDRLARQIPKCGDCVLKLVLNQVSKGLSPLLPDAATQPRKRAVVVKSVMRYRYTIINPDALFVMVTDAEQIDSTLVNKVIRQKKELAGQLCLNDDVSTEDPQELQDVQEVMTELYQGLFPEKSQFEI